MLSSKIIQVVNTLYVKEDYIYLLHVNASIVKKLQLQDLQALTPCE